MKLNKVTIKREQFVNVCNDLDLDVYDLAGSDVFDKKDVEITLERMPGTVLQALITQPGISRAVKSLANKVFSQIAFSRDLFDQTISSLEELEVALRRINLQETPVIKLLISKRYYPVRPNYVGLQHGFFGSNIYMTCPFCICDEGDDKRIAIYPDQITDMNSKFKTLREILKSVKIEEFTEADNIAHRARMLKTTQLGKKVGTVIDVSSSVLVQDKSFWGSGWLEVQLGSHGRSCQGIIDDRAEMQNPDDDSGNDSGRLPFVRMFSLDLKAYVYVDVDDFEPHVFDKTMREKLVLPQDMTSVLYSVFDSGEVFTDIFSDRSGGMVILTNGPSGVGKTLTAEVFAEYAGRPLYVMEMGELGTNLAAVEQSLQRIFHRASRWNAVLLFDEADIFMAKRSETDLERSAIVGVFLRLLDRYHGMFFLTTNRAEVIDPAFCSRVTLALNYPALGASSREKIWTQMLTAAGFKCDPKTIATLAEKFDINGRQIRNQVRLLRVLYPKEKALKLENFERSLQYVANSYT